MQIILARRNGYRRDKNAIAMIQFDVIFKLWVKRYLRTVFIQVIY